MKWQGHFTREIGVVGRRKPPWTVSPLSLHGLSGDKGGDSKMLSYRIKTQKPIHVTLLSEQTGGSEVESKHRFDFIDW